MHPLLNTGLVVAILAAGAAAQAPASRPTTDWHDAKSLLIEGQGWAETSAAYTRLPDSAKGVVRDPVWKDAHFGHAAPSSRLSFRGVNTVDRGSPAAAR